MDNHTDVQRLQYRLRCSRTTEEFVPKHCPVGSSQCEITLHGFSNGSRVIDKRCFHLGFFRRYVTSRDVYTCALTKCFWVVICLDIVVARMGVPRSTFVPSMSAYLRMTTNGP